MKRRKSGDISKIAVKIKKTQADIAIEERLTKCAKGESEHIIYVGEVVERTLKGEFGAIIKALTAGRTSRELAENRDGKMSADRILGRIEMAEILWNDLEQFVEDKDKALEPVNLEEAATKFYNYTVSA